MGQWYSQAENERLRFELEMALRENEKLRLQLKMREDGEQHLIGEIEARDLEIARLGGPVAVEDATVAPDPKPPQRKRASRDEWNDIVLWSRGQPCRICGLKASAARPHTLHHLVPRSLGGDDDPRNLIVLCGTGTTGCHGRVEGRRDRARAILRDSLWEANRDYLREKFGSRWVAWLNRNYEGG